MQHMHITIINPAELGYIVSSTLYISAGLEHKHA
jgi:hypothetical protein